MVVVLWRVGFRGFRNELENIKFAIKVIFLFSLDLTFFLYCTIFTFFRVRVMVRVRAGVDDRGRLAIRVFVEDCWIIRLLCPNILESLSLG